MIVENGCIYQIILWHLNVDFTASYGTIYTVYFDVGDYVSVGTKTPDPITLCEVKGTGGTKKYIDSSGTISDTPTVTLPTPNIKNVDGYSVAGWVDNNNKYHATESSFTLTSTETTLKVYWDSFYMSTDDSNGYEAPATLTLPKGEWYICFIGVNVNNNEYTTSCSISVTENVTYEDISNPENIDSRLKTISCDISGDTGTIMIGKKAYVFEAVAFAKQDDAETPIVSFVMGGNPLSTNLSIPAGKWQIRTYGSGNSYDRGRYFLYRGLCLGVYGPEYTTPAGVKPLVYKYPPNEDTGMLMFDEVYNFTTETRVNYYLRKTVGTTNGLSRVIVIAPYRN